MPKKNAQDKLGDKYVVERWDYNFYNKAGNTAGAGAGIGAGVGSHNYKKGDCDCSN